MVITNKNMLMIATAAFVMTIVKAPAATYEQTPTEADEYHTSAYYMYT
jgi:hypothetical protein